MLASSVLEMMLWNTVMSGSLCSCAPPPSGPAQPQPGLTPPGLMTTPEDVRQARPQLLTPTQSSEVPAVVTGIQQTKLGAVGGDPGPGPQHPGLDQLRSLLLGRLLVDRTGKQVAIRLPGHHSLVVLLGGVVQELHQHYTSVLLHVTIIFVSISS